MAPPKTPSFWNTALSGLQSIGSNIPSFNALSSDPRFIFGLNTFMQPPSLTPRNPMGEFIQAQQFADAQGQRQFFPELLADKEAYENYGTELSERLTPYVNPITGELTDPATQDLAQRFSQTPTLTDMELKFGEGGEFFDSPEPTAEQIDLARDPRKFIMDQASALQTELGLTAAPVDPLDPTNLSNRLLMSKVPSLQRAGLAQVFKPKSYMAFDPWQPVVDVNTGKIVDFGQGPSSSMMDPRLMSAGYKGALSEGISPILSDGTPNPEFNRRVRTLNQKTERTGPATMGTKLEQLNTAKDEGRITEAGHDNQVKQLLRNQWKNNLTESDLQIEKDISKKFTNWQFQGGRFQDLKDIDQVEQVIKDYLNDTPITGNILTNRLPKFIKAKLNPSAVMDEDRILEITQRTLREILGAQFTEKEGQMIMDRAWRTDLPPKELARRAQRMVAVLKAKQGQLNSAYDYWRTEQLDIENLSYKPARSILGFEQKDGMSAEDFIRSLNLDETELRGKVVG